MQQSREVLKQRPACARSPVFRTGDRREPRSGSPQEVRLIFNRTITRRTLEQFRTRIVTQDITPSLNVYYKNTRIKQYHKEGRALRTETTINNSYDFGVRKRLHNLPKLREIGFAANRRLLEVERLSPASLLPEHPFQAINS